MKNWSALEWVIALTIALLVIGSPTWYVFSSYMESKTYNKLTGAHTTTWDAMWVELRVQDKPVESK